MRSGKDKTMLERDGQLSTTKVLEPAHLMKPMSTLEISTTHTKKFKPMNKEDCKLINMVFAKDNTKKRKTWIRNIQEGMTIQY